VFAKSRPNVLTLPLSINYTRNPAISYRTYYLLLRGLAITARLRRPKPMSPTSAELNSHIAGGTGIVAMEPPVSWAAAETVLEKFNISPLLTMTPTDKVPCF